MAPSHPHIIPFTDSLWEPAVAGGQQRVTEEPSALTDAVAFIGVTTIDLSDKWHRNSVASYTVFSLWRECPKGKLVHMWSQCTMTTLLHLREKHKLKESKQIAPENTVSHVWDSLDTITCSVIYNHTNIWILRGGQWIQKVQLLEVKIKLKKNK